MRRTDFSFLRHPGTVILLIILLVGIFLPLFINLDPFSTGISGATAPGSGNLLGTTRLGQDCFARLVIGFRTSLLVAFTAAVLATIIGTLVGLSGGFAGGLVDSVSTIITNLLIVVPQLIILILLANILEETSLLMISVFIGCSSWPWMARALRAQAVSLRLREHVALARLNNQSFIALLVKQILPYISSYAVMAFVMQLGSALFSEAALSMLGLGPGASEVVTLGRILNEANQNGAFAYGRWWEYLPPTILITLFISSLYSVNTSLETRFNPRMRSR